jgi:O-antigen ligase
LAFVIAVLPLSLIAVFETVRHWLLYSSVSYAWAGESAIHYLERGSMLRASGPAISPIVLGFVIMVALGCMLALQQSIGARKFSKIAIAVIGAGLVASLSRGPWVGAMALVLVFLVMSPYAFSNLAKFAVIGAIALLPLLLTPVGTRLLDILPFIGSVDVRNVTYRQQLFDNAMIVIERNLWLGSTDFRLTPEMQEMMQGEHIIDIVNTYLSIALESGLVGLGLFLSFFAAILIPLLRIFKVHRDDGLGPCVRASTAILLAIMVTIATVSSIDFIPLVYWSFGGLCVALIRIGYTERVVRPASKRLLTSGSSPH